MIVMALASESHGAASSSNLSFAAWTLAAREYAATCGLPVSAADPGDLACQRPAELEFVSPQGRCAIEIRHVPSFDPRSFGRRWTGRSGSAAIAFGQLLSINPAGRSLVPP
jgi:hypothetical protein